MNHIEAMKQALEALRDYRRSDDDRVSVAMGILQEALAEQPAQQQEPIAKVCHDLEGHIGWNPKLTQLPDEGTKLYTSPPPRKPWVGLTDEEKSEIYHNQKFVVGFYSPAKFADAIEAKLKEKNT